jgi:hypothetical protein
MYIESITIKNFRTFRDARIDFSHKERHFDADFPAPKLKNINLLLGNNGLGKTTLLKAISLSALGPAVSDSGIFPYRLIRREPGELPEESAVDPNLPSQDRAATLEARFVTHSQDKVPSDVLESRVSLFQRGDLEQLRWTHDEEKIWHSIFSSSSDAFFFVGYGASRRVEKRDTTDIASRRQSSFARAQRIQSIFEEAYSLLPLSAWLPSYKDGNPGRYKQVVTLINKLMGKGHYGFTGEMEGNEFVFERGGLKVPFPALSDGYRAYLGWICDLLYHICMTCPPGSMLVENHGIVMVDEIDLHIHPEWQLNILPTLARALPNIQFIVTSHSPLVAGSLEWMNIIVMAPGSRQSSSLRRIEEPIHGLDADQILLTDFFGLQSTRAEAKESQLKKLTELARQGDTDAAKELLKELSRGME